MSNFSNKKYDDLKKIFYDTAKKILNYEKGNINSRKLPEDPEKVEEFKIELLQAFNNLLICTGKYFDTFIVRSKKVTTERFLSKYQPYFKELLRHWVLLLNYHHCFKLSKK